MKKIFLLSLIFLLFLAARVDAYNGKRYWVGGTSTWNTSANWSLTSGGGGGAGVPGVNDTAYFDTGGVTCTMDANGSVKRMEMSAGTLVQSTFTLIFGTSGALLSGGIFTGGSATITSAGLVTNSGCAFTSTSGLFTTNSSFTLSGGGSFTHNNGKLRFTSTSTITGSLALYQLEFAPTSAATYTIAGGTILTVTNALTISGTVVATINTGDIEARGDIVITNTGSGSGGNAILTINGIGNQLIDGAPAPGNGRLPNVVINKSGGTLSMQDVISLTGDWTRTAGDTDPGTSTVFMAGTKTITGTDTMYNLTFGIGTYTISGGTVLNANHTLTLQGAFDLTLNTGTINARGDIINTNTATGGGGTAAINICGTGNQTLDGSGGGVQGRLPNVIINKPSGTLYLQDYIAVIGDWTRTAGDTDPGTSNVHLSGTKTITGTDTFYNVAFGSSSTYTIATGTILNVINTLQISGGFNCVINTGTIHAWGDVTVTNTATGTGGTATIVVNGTGNQTLTGSGVAGEGKLPNITIDKPSGVLTLASIISVTGNWIYTDIGSGSINSTGSTVAFYGSFNLDGQRSGSTAVMPFNNITINTSTRTLTGHVDANNDFTIASSATCSAGSNKIYVGGDWNSQGTWTYGTSTVIFDGVNHNRIRGVAGTINFANVEVNRNVPGPTPKSVRLLNPVLINTAMTLAKGRIISTPTNYLSFADNATCTVTNDDSAYVHGPVRKTGNDVFSFPLGDTTLHDSMAYHPLAITAPSSTGDQYEATYFASAQSQGSATVDSLTNLSTAEYWTLTRTPGSSAVTVTLGWNRNSPPSSISDMRVAGWNSGSSVWADLGQASITVNWPQGTVAASVTTLFNSNSAVLTTASSSRKYYGYATLKRKLDGGFYEAKGNALYFRFDDEYNDQSHYLTYSIYNTANTDVAPTLVGSSNNAALTYYGDNRFKLDLWTNTTALTAGYYILEVRNEKNEVFYLRFKKN